MSKFLFKTNNYIVLKSKRGFIVYNKNKKWGDGHTHVNSIKMCNTIIDLATHENLPKSNDIWLYESILRIISNKDKTYKINLLNRIDEIQKDKEEIWKN